MGRVTPEFVSWRVGRTFSRWHLSRKHEFTLCGVSIGQWAVNRTRSGIENQDVCSSCLAALAAEDVPVPQGKET